MAAHGLQIVRSPHVQASLQASPAGVTLRRVTTRQATLWAPEGIPAARQMARIGAASPRKGNEAKRLWAEYLRRNPNSADLVMTMREYLGAVFSWTFQRGTGIELRDLFGSMLTFTLAADFVGAADGSGVDKEHTYLMAASEGYACLSGKAANRMAREMALGAGLTFAKNAFRSAAEEAESTSGDEATVTPAQFAVARWWEGFFPPLLRVTFGTAPYRHLTDDAGTYVPALECQAIARVLGNVLRYNDVIDAIPDYVNHETANEFLLALAYGSTESTLGFADALAEATDAALACECGQPGHDEAAEHTMGFTLFYLLVPRYNARRQLVALTGAGGDIRRAFTPPRPGERLRSTQYKLDPGLALHTPDWQPQWQPGTRSIDETALRAARRALIGPTSSSCIKAAADVLSRCDRVDSAESLNCLAEGWQRLFDTALATNGISHLTYAAPLRDLVGRIWRHTILDSQTDQDALLFIDTDIAIRNTFSLSADHGLRLRRAFFGVTTSAVEYSGFSPYRRLANGISALCRSEE
ncbi:hypothetical protein [Streptomyces sp. NBC_00878]|uniref:hypothetical protein n=1 Tax=Streptomyces sp. NBC_00878 TaxID=2975854 RepID=UPI002258095C|nr:hypothetical protein [Streptomyces sp. NBC_00878]MCX4910121.1 hypothetical protein [Streptomyces sp. NBC_00878]